MANDEKNEKGESIPRRNNMNLWTPAELAIYNAAQEVERIGADPRLTEAGNLLTKAQDLIAEYVDDQKGN